MGQSPTPIAGAGPAAQQGEIRFPAQLQELPRQIGGLTKEIGLQALAPQTLVGAT